MLRLVLDEGVGHYLMAMDEALLYSVAMGGTPTLRLYVFSNPTVTIGYFQKIEESVDLDLAYRDSIDVVRRVTGGGSVYHDPHGEITYSVIMPEAYVPRDFVESFRYLSSGVIEAARLLGVPAEFAPLNDGVIAGRKFSGQAQIRRFGVVLQHGTLMYATDLDKLSEVLKIRGVKFSLRGPIRERVTTLSEYLGRTVTRDEALRALVEGFKRGLGVELREDSYTEIELRLASELEWKYRSREWLFTR
ncbi:MAG: biotin/lipoate A/B protein ligase family protein [Sulfolobales archaeon]|nr:lipoate--protein ligase family protein [Sulfolobales archaeon]MDW8082987.1 biotin/lipoate A/B protein ligase family protein [Sulfolobales archaeon]